MRPYSTSNCRSVILCFENETRNNFHTLQVFALNADTNETTANPRSHGWNAHATG